MKSSKVCVFGIPNCDSVKKARKWLEANNIDYEFHDFKKAGLEKETLSNWISLAGWEALLNRRGTTWRNVPPETRDKIDENVAVELMLKTPSIIKRPVIRVSNNILVGFNPEQYAEVIG